MLPTLLLSVYTPVIKEPMIILIDNYDSFTYNLVQYFGDLGRETTVYRNDQITPQEIFDFKLKVDWIDLFF